LKTLLTGASGFIGQRLLTSLEKTNNKIRVLARKQLPGYETVVCDLAQEQIPLSSLELIETIFHIAGYAHDLQGGYKVDHLYRSVNVNSTVHLAELAVQQGVQRFIFVSSVKAGGSAITGQCLSESDQGEPEGVYGKTKREAELKLLNIGRQSDMHVSIVRPSLVYGQGVKGNLRMMLGGIQQGWFPPLPEIGNRRSMIHVDDLVQALLLVAVDARANGEIFIATDGHQYSSREIYNAMCNGIGKTVPLWSVPKLLFDCAALIHPRVRYKIEKLLGDECFSSEKLESLGFKPKKTIKEIND